MANELLYVPGIGSRYYYNATTAGTVTLNQIGSGSFSSAVENGHPTLTFNGKAFQFTIGSGMSGSHTIEYWLSMPSWNNTGTSHQWGYIGSRSVSYELWRPKPASGTNNVNFQLDFEYPDPEDTSVTLADQTTPVHVAEVFDTSDSNYQLKLYVNGTKVKQHYFNLPWANTIVLGGSVSSYGATSLADAFTGKISEFLVSTGAKYTADFTPERATVDKSALTKAGNPVENFTAPEISYLEVDDIPYKIVAAS